MTKEKEVEEEEVGSEKEKETASDDEEEHYVEAPKYNEIMSFLVMLNY